MLESNFHVAIDRVMHVDDALALMRQNQYALVLFNRLIFDSGAEGTELVRRAKADPALAAIPMMMISNYAEAQAAAVEAGAIEGFGKASLDAPGTIERLARYLPRMNGVTRLTP